MYISFFFVLVSSSLHLVLEDRLGIAEKLVDQLKVREQRVGRVAEESRLDASDKVVRRPGDASADQRRGRRQHRVQPRGTANDADDADRRADEVSALDVLVLVLGHVDHMKLLRIARLQLNAISGELDLGHECVCLCAVRGRKWEN